MTSMKFAVAAAAVLMGGAAQADVSISNQPTANMDCEAGACTATAQKAVLNVTDLQTMLAGGDVAVKTGALAKDIAIDQPLSWSSTSRLTVDAQQSVAVKKPVTIAGTGAVTIIMNDGDSGGDLYFSNQGSITFWDMASDLNINDQDYVLVVDIASLSSAISANPSGAYALASDYDATPDGVYAESPVETELSGTFEGLGHTISNLAISTQNVDAGLFLDIGSTGTVRDVSLGNLNISSILNNPSNAGRVGGIAAQSAGLIVSSSASGLINIPATNDFPLIGGLVGESSGIISHARSNVRISATDFDMDIGGIAGLVQSIDGSVAEVIDVSAAGSISAKGDATVGGLVGAVQDGAVSFASASGNVSGGQGGLVGGLLGGIRGNVDDSFATGKVSVGKGASRKGQCGAFAGGLAGAAWGLVTNSYATGAVRGRDGSCVGGFVGAVDYGVGSSSVLSDSYSLGAVSARGTAQVGGLAGHCCGRGKVQHAYWDTETSGTNSAAGNSTIVKGAEGLTSDELKSLLPKGLRPNTWGLDPNINGGFPFLLANPPK